MIKLVENGKYFTIEIMNGTKTDSYTAASKQGLINLLTDLMFDYVCDKNKHNQLNNILMNVK